MSCSIISSNLQFYLRSLLRENHNCRMLVTAMFEGSWLNLAAISMCHRWCYRCCRRTGLQKHVRNNGNFPLLYLWTALLTVCTIDSNTVARFVIMCLFLSTKLGEGQVSGCTFLLRLVVIRKRVFHELTETQSISH